MAEHRHRAKFDLRKQLFLAGMVVAVALLIAAASYSFGHPFLSPEVKFTDASRSGLSIVPASCPSTPDFPGQCDTPPTVPPGDCSVTASQYNVNPGQTFTVNWDEDVTPDFVNPSVSIYINTDESYEVEGSGYGENQGVYNGPISGGTPDGQGDYNFSGSLQETAPDQPGDDYYYTVWGTENNYPVPILPYCDAEVYISPTSICPDGSQAPNGDPSQCTCAQGNQAACNDNNGGCPAGSSFENGQCVEVCQGSGEFGEGQGTSCSCPSGFTAENGECVWSNCPTGYTEQNGQCSFTGCPTGYTEQNGQCVSSPACSAGYICESGNQYYENASCTISSSPTQTCNYGCFSGACLAPPSPELATWSVVPALLKSGETTNVSWQAENVTSCSITGSNGDSWSGLQGSETSSPILSQTIYTITCQGLAGATPSSVSTSTTVNIVPTYQEI